MEESLSRKTAGPMSAICEADMLFKSQDVAAIVFGNTLSISRRDVPGIHDRPTLEPDALTVLTTFVSSRGRGVAAVRFLVP